MNNTETLEREPIEVRVARLYAEIAAINADIEGMKAENLRITAYGGRYIPYTESFFAGAAERIREATKNYLS
jgi:hypothetical protein